MKAVRTNLENKSSTLSIFCNVNYILLFLGGLVSRIGNGIHYVGVCWYVLEKSGSGVALGTILMTASIPSILLGPVSGVMVDRLNRKQLIIWMDLIRGVLVLAMAYLLMGKALTYPVLLIGTFLISICGTLFNPAITATIPNLVKDHELSKANSLESLSYSLTGVIGAALGGILIGLFGVPGTFMANGISFIVSAISEMFIQIPPTRRPVRPVVAEAEQETQDAKTSIFQEMVDGLKFIFGNRLLRTICSTSIALNFCFIGALGVALPYVVKEVMGFGEMRFGLMDSFFPLGSIIAALLIMVLPEVKRIYRLTVGGLALHGIILILIGLAIWPLAIKWLTVKTSYMLVALLMVGMGIVNVIINVPIMTLFQRLVPDEIRGRFFAILTTFTQGLIPLAYLVSGVILEIWSPHALMILGGLAVIMIAFNMTRLKEFRAL